MAEIHGLFYIRGYFHHEKLGWFLPSSHQKKPPYIHIPLHWGDQVIHLGPWGWSSWLPAGSGMPEIGQVPFGCSSRIAATVTGLFDAVQGIGGALAWCNHPGPIKRISVTYFFGGLVKRLGWLDVDWPGKKFLIFEVRRVRLVVVVAVVCLSLYVLCYVSWLLVGLGSRVTIALSWSKGEMMSS